MIYIIIYIISIIFMVPETGLCEPKISSPKISPGFDWSLPKEVKHAEYSGVCYSDVKPDRPYMRGILRTLTWGDLNPKEGVYDFTQLDKFIDEVSEFDGWLMLRIKCSVVWRDSPWVGVGGLFIPEWVLDKHKPKVFNTQENIRIAVPWNPGVQKEYKKFVKEFVKQGYLAKPEIAGIYLHGIGSSFGEEMWMEPDYIDHAKKAGMTPEKLYNALASRMEFWAEAGGKYKHKIGWVCTGWLMGYEKTVYTNLDHYAMELGLGKRHGGFDGSFNAYLPPGHGQSWDDDSHIIVDWSHPLRAEKRFFATEEEQFQYKGVEASGAEWEEKIPVDEKKYLAESSLMRVAQIGMNFVWTSDRVINKAPDIYRWYTFVAGKLPAESPDAICWLREDYVRARGPDRSWTRTNTIKNFERMVWQRDFPEAQTQPVIRIDRQGLYTDAEGLHYGYLARKTDVKNGQKNLLFFLHKDFRNSIKNEAEIKITYFDNTRNKWVLKVSMKGTLLVSKKIEGKGDGKWRTATFELNQKPEPGKLEHKVDFKLEIISGGDLTVKFVRIVKKM